MKMTGTISLVFEKNKNGLQQNKQQFGKSAV